EMQRGTRLRKLTRRALRIPRRNVDVADHAAQQAEAEQHARLEEVALPDRRIAEEWYERTVDGGVAIGRIENVPISGRELRQEGEAGIAESTATRHRAKLALVEKAIALRVVGPADHDGRDQRQQVIGIHLPVGVHLRDDLCAESGGALVPCHHRGSNALVLFELYQIDSGIADISDHLARRIGTPVVDHYAVPDEPGHAPDAVRA